MAYYLSAERSQDVVASYRRYQEYLREHEKELPPGAFALGTSVWYQDANDHRCPHDGWLENLIISEIPGSDKRRMTTVRIRLLAAYQDGFIELFYPNVLTFRFENEAGSGRMGDWRYDEFRLSNSGHLIHEIEWSMHVGGEGSRWIIEATDVQFQWIPQTVSVSH